MTLSRPVHSEGVEPGFEAIGGREPYMAHSQHPAIFWHFCGNFCMSRGASQKLLMRSRYEKCFEKIFCTRSKKNGMKMDPRISNPTSRCFRFRGLEVHPEINLFFRLLMRLIPHRRKTEKTERESERFF